MRNAAARYNLNSFQVIGPRQGLIVALLHSCKALMSVSEITKAFKLPSNASQSVRSNLKRLIDKGLVVRDVSTATPTSDGFYIGERFTVSDEGRTLARRMQKITGLGNTFAVVRGRTPKLAA